MVLSSRVWACHSCQWPVEFMLQNMTKILCSAVGKQCWNSLLRSPTMAIGHILVFKYTVATDTGTGTDLFQHSSTGTSTGWSKLQSTGTCAWYKARARFGPRAILSIL